MNGDPWGLPSHWRWQRFDDVARVASHLVDPALYPSVPHIAPNHIESGTGRLLPYATVAADGVTSPKHHFRPGHVLYSKIRPYLAKVAFADFEGLCSADMYPIEAGPSLDARFLRWWMLTREFTRRAAGEQARTVLPKINRRSLGSLPVPLPPLEEQRRIVDILEDHLSRLDAASAYLRRAEARASAFSRSSVESAIRSTPSRRLRLHEVVARLEAGKSFGAGGRPAAADEWGIIKVSAMTWGAFRPEENKAVPDPARVNAAYEIHAGDVLVSRANTTEYVGASVYVETTRPRLLLSDKSLRIVPRDGVDPRWLQTVLSAPSTRAQISERATGTKDSMRNISQPALLSVQIPVPAASDQTQVVAVATGAADAAARLLNAVQRTSRRVAALRRALLDAAFSGRLTGASSDMDRVEELAGG